MSENKNDISLLNEMIAELNNQNDLYKPGNYWKNFEKGIIKQIKSNDLKNLRNWPGGTPGNIQSFGGGDDLRYRKYGENFHPFDKKFDIFDKINIFNLYNRAINKISKYIPFFSFFSIRSIEGKKHYFQKIKFFHNLLHNFLSVYDKEIALIEDSKSGNPEGSVIKNKFYTSSYFFYLLFATIIKKNIEIKNIKFVIELGSGVGFMGYLLKKLNTNIKYICCDLPPAIFVAEKYLKNSGFKVAGYDYFKNIYSIDEVEFDKYDCFCLPNWKAEILKDFKNDLFINIGSFQEMEKKQVNNYMNIFFKNTKYILLHQTIFSKEVALKKKDHGVLDSVDKKFYYENLKKYSFVERDYLDMGDKFSAFFVSERNKS